MSRVLRRHPSLNWLLPLLLLFAAVLLFFHKMAFSNLILARGDTFLYFYPYWQMAADALRAGRLPLWNPAIFMGAPFLANSQTGLFYPPNWPVWLALQTPYAVSASIIGHLLLAGSGVFFAARRWLNLAWPAALLAGIAFALGGYLTAQVEHINQLQGLAWLPWFLWLLGGIRSGARRAWLVAVCALAALFALQFLAGHMQTSFITAVALFIWITALAVGQRLAAKPDSMPAGRLWLARLLSLAAAGLLSLGLVAVQLLPTLELTRLSSREGGLPVNEVLSFSLPPVHLSRALLPGYGQSLFSEYVAFLPLTFLALAFIGAWQWRSRPAALAALVLALSGLLLALGAFNPLYWLLARLPGFDLFRVPARWLVLYALGTSLLAGLGWQVLHDVLRARTPNLAPTIRQPLTWFLPAALLLMAWGWLAGAFTGVLPVGPEAPFEAPTVLTAAGWAVEMILLILLAAFLGRARQRSSSLAAPLLLGGVVLFLASRVLPYNNLTTPAAYFDIRPPAARLIAGSGTPPDRLLSLSGIRFDPGDQAEIDSIYADQLPAAAQYDYTIAIKQKEIIAPNLPMIYDLASVDGFDGGILPLRAYTEQMTLVLPPGMETTDGRLREQLTAVPEARWLDLYNTRYLITDKVGDEWRDGVFYDRQHSLTIAPGQTVTAAGGPPFEATELRLLQTAAPQAVQLRTADGQEWTLAAVAQGSDLYHLPFPEPAVVEEVTVSGCAGDATCVLQALTLVDTRDATFQTLVAGGYRLIHSGDVKIYENLDVLPRAFVVHDWQWAVDGPTSVARMAEASFDARETAVLVAPPAAIQPAPQDQLAASATTEVRFEQVTPEAVHLTVALDQAGMLVLTDAAYPGWQATIDGQAAPIYLANGLFRGVYVPAGHHEVRFEFVPESYQIGRLLSLAALALWGLVVLLLTLRRPRF